MTSQSGYSLGIVRHLPTDGDVSAPWCQTSVRDRPEPKLAVRDRSPYELLSHDCEDRDQRLVDAARSGCPRALAELWDLYSGRIYSTTLSIVRNPHDAQDALQDAFLRAIMSIETFEGRASFYTWLTRIAINSALGILRNRRRKREISLDSTYEAESGHRPEDLKDLAPGPEEVLDVNLRHEGLRQAMGRLPVKLREALYTLISEDCSVAEVARRLNISYSAAKSRLHRARAIMSSSIDPGEPRLGHRWH